MQHEFAPHTTDSAHAAWPVWKILAAVSLGCAAMTLSSRISLPLYPVPVTGQTYAVCMIGALYGPRLGATTLITFLLCAAVGLPVLANGGGGLGAFAGPTAGYLLSWPVSAALVGHLVARGWDGRHPFLAFMAMLAGGTLCLFLGAATLSMIIGFKAALVHGVAPFLLGDVLKSALAAATLCAICGLRARRTEL